MRAVGYVAIGAGLLSLLAAFLPLSQVNGYQYSIGIEQLGAVQKLLYVLPLAVLVLGTLVVTGNLRSPRPWLAVTGLTGLLLAGLATVGAIGNLEMMGSLFGLAAGSKVSAGVGAYAAFLAYGIVAVAGMY